MASSSNRYVSDDGREVWKELEKIHSFGYGYATIFGDWVDLILNALLSLTANMGKADLIERFLENRFEDEYNARYLEIVRKYRENSGRPQGQRPIDYFTNAWGMLQLETKQKNRDIIGQIYMERVTFGEAGQFFTPSHVTEMMAKMIQGDGEKAEDIKDSKDTKESKERHNVYDPCCGSGRFLIDFAKENPNAVLYGTDIDSRCAKMAALNMWLFDLEARVTCGDSLTQSWWIGWETSRGGYIREISPPKAEPVGDEPPLQKKQRDCESSSEKQLDLGL